MEALTRFARFDAKVDTSPGHGPRGDCHVWTGFVDPRGRGRLGFEGNRSTLAQRVAWLKGTASGPRPSRLAAVILRASVWITSSTLERRGRRWPSDSRPTST